MTKECVEERDGGYLVAGTRVSLDSVVYAFLRGTAAESIAQSYPVLSLEPLRIIWRIRRRLTLCSRATTASLNG